MKHNVEYVEALNITRGIGVIKTNNKRQKHLNNLQSSKNQLQFVMKDKGTLSLETVDVGVWCRLPKYFQTLNVVGKNYLFQSCGSDNELYHKMFPDSEISKNYQTSSTKFMYLLRHRINPYFKLIWQSRFKGKLSHFNLTKQRPNK